MNPNYKVSKTPVMIQGHICDLVNLHRLPADSEAVDNHKLTFPPLCVLLAGSRGTTIDTV